MNKYIFDVPFPKPISEKEYWEKQAKFEKLKPLKKCCGDCAIKTGFYTSMADSLKKQPIELQKRVAEAWFCHNAPNRGCAGVIKYLNLDQTP